jgi:hypothetical protein
MKGLLIYKYMYLNSFIDEMCLLFPLFVLVIIVINFFVINRNQLFLLK